LIGRDLRDVMRERHREMQPWLLRVLMAGIGLRLLKVLSNNSIRREYGS
jgi:hypothetical protein